MGDRNTKVESPTVRPRIRPAGGQARDAGDEGSPVPNFFLVGAFKSGTTSLYQYLRQHPDVYLSPRKEPAFFVSEFCLRRLPPEWRRLTQADAEAFARYLDHPHWGPQPRGLLTEWTDYLKLFKAASPDQAIGEGSVGCLWSKTAARGISKRIPHARILMILRNPCDRALSQYLALKPSRLMESFSMAIQRSASADEDGLFASLNPFLEFGMYSEQVARFREHFPADQVRIYLYDDFVSNPEWLVRDVFRFLNVRQDIRLDLTTRYNEPRIARFPELKRAVITPLARRVGSFVPPTLRRWINRARLAPRHTVTMRPDDRRFLVDYYIDDVRRLAAMIERDLSSWLVE